MTSFSIIIVTWNGLEHLKNYLPSVAETDYPSYEIIIADNASSDGTKQWVESHFPDIKIAAFDDNYGYCGGNNRAVPFAKNDVLVFLNNDVKVDKNWLYGLNKALEKDDVAAAQPKVKSLKEPTYFEYAGAAGGFIDKFGYPFCRGRIFDDVEADNGQYDDETDIFWASGAALAIHKNIFTDCGGFDESFEFHMEEIDLCWRLQNQGYRIGYAPESVVYHLGGGSLPMGSPRKVYYNFRNSLFMLWKNYSTASLLTRFPTRILLDIVAAFKALLSGNLREFGAVVKAHMHFLGGLKKVHQKRKVLRKEITRAQNPRTMMNLSIVWNYYLKGITVFSELINKKS